VITSRVQLVRFQPLPTAHSLIPRPVSRNYDNGDNGCNESTAADVLHAMANLLPVHLLRVVDNLHCHKIALRLIHTPSHPLHEPNAVCKRPLHDLIHTDKISTNTAETTRQSTQRTPSFKTRIATTREKAIGEEARDKADVKVYTDGSGMDGMIGAGAVLYRGGMEKAKSRYRLGTKEQHTVYEGECMGIAMGVKLMSKEWNFKTATICTDSQETIRAMYLNKKVPGHHILDPFHRELDKLQKTHRGIQSTLRWIPGHKGIKGNEMADKEAKRAISDLEGGSCAAIPPTIPEKERGRKTAK
jgi:ribonuclease HI